MATRIAMSRYEPPPVAEKQLWEVTLVFSKEDQETHLVLATGQEDAIQRFLKLRNMDTTKTVRLYRAERCTRYKTVTLGHRSYT
jgi:hypothetical protein